MTVPDSERHVGHGSAPSREAGLLLYIMVDSVAAAIDAVIANGELVS